MAPDLSSIPQPEAPLPGSPFRPEPEQPRLGIIHLLVWTACVAGYFGVIRGLAPPAWSPRLGPSLGIWVGVAMGRATGLGGLLLFAARRYRRLPFPRQPGETLLVLLGVGAAGHLLDYPIRYGAVYLGTIPRWVPDLSFLLAVVLAAVLYLIAAVRTKILRWRVYFVTVFVAGALMVLLLLLRPLEESLLVPPFILRRLIPFVWHWAPLVPGAVLVFVAVKDARQGLRYRWTHWLGIGIGLWNGLMGAMWAAWLTWSVPA